MYGIFQAEKRRKSIPNRNSMCKSQKQQNHGTFREERQLRGIFSTSLTDWLSVTALTITFDNFTGLERSYLTNCPASRQFTSNHHTERQSEKEFALSACLPARTLIFCLWTDGTSTVSFHSSQALRYGCGTPPSLLGLHYLLPTDLGP